MRRKSIQIAWLLAIIMFSSCGKKHDPLPKAIVDGEFVTLSLPVGTVHNRIIFITINNAGTVNSLTFQFSADINSIFTNLVLINSSKKPVGTLVYNSSTHTVTVSGIGDDLKAMYGSYGLYGDVPLNAPSISVTCTITRDGIDLTGATFDSLDPIQSDIIITTRKIYAAGTDGYDAVYWLNGTRTFLASGSVSSQGAGLAMVVSGSDVYVAGTDGMDAWYWKNGVGTKLEGGGRATGVAVSGTDVYVSGGPLHLVTGAAVYWKNGVKTSLSPNGIATGIDIANGDVYISGSIMGLSDYVAVVWKNNVPDTLEEGNIACAVLVSGTDVYAGGSFHQFPAVWKNGVPDVQDNLDQGQTPEQGQVLALALSGSDVYAAGFRSIGSPSGYLWKNGAVVIQGSYKFYGMSLSGGEIYLAGDSPLGARPAYYMLNAGGFPKELSMQHGPLYAIVVK